MPETIITKICPKCKNIKSLLEFCKCSSHKDGYQSWCKTCMKKNNSSYQKSEKGKQAQRRYEQNHVEQIKQHRKQYKQSENGKQICLQNVKRYQKRNPDKRRAHQKVNNVIQVGRLPRPNILQCYYCPEKAEQYHHHLGYKPEHWLDVIPVCIDCHKKIHRNERLYSSN